MRGLVVNVVVLLLAVAAFVAFERFIFPPTDAAPVERIDLAVGDIKRGSGNTHVVDLPEHWVSDTGEKPFQSRVVLYQDGQRNARAHRSHSEVAMVGGGAYSHWGGKLLFSTLDNQPVESVKLQAVLEPPVDSSGEIAEKALSMFAMLLVLGWLLLLHWQLRDRDWGSWQPVIDTLWLVIVAVIWFGVVTLGADLLHPKQELRVVANESGHSFIAQLDGGEIESGDTTTSPRRSPYFVFEDGAQLGPAHTAHRNIAESGGGAFSHWHDRIYFSSSDGSNPLENGRRYQIGKPVPEYVLLVSLLPLAAAGLYALTLLLWPLARRVSGRQWLQLAWLGAIGLSVWGYSALNEERLLNEAMVHRDGHAWVSPLYSAWRGPLDPHTVLEDEMPIGPGGQSYQNIVAEGEGRYTYWNDALTFSASDNVAPDISGRQYSAVLYPPSWYWLAVLCVLLVLVGITLSQTSRNGPWLLVVLPCLLLFAAAYWLHAIVFPGHIAVVPDSYSYVNFTGMRPIVYPWIVDLVRWLTGGLDGLLIVHLLVLIAAIGLWAFGLGRLAKTPLVGLLFLVGVATCYPLFVAAGVVLSEPVFTALSILTIAAMSAYVYTEQRWVAVAAGVVITLLILTRPVGYAAIPLVLCLVALNFRRTRFRPLIMLAVPIGTVSIIALLSTTFDIDRRDNSIGPQAILGHVAWAVSADEKSRFPQLSAELASAVAPVLEERPEHLEYPLEYQAYTTNEYNRLLWGKMTPVLRKNEFNVGSSSISEAALVIALETISREPAAYLRHVAAHYIGLWVHQFDRPASVTDKLRSNYAATEEILQLASLGNINREQYAIDDTLTYGRISFWEVTNRWFPAVVRQGLIGVLLCISLLAPVMVLTSGFKISRAHCVLALMCLFLHGYFVTTALAQVAIARYIWPVEWLSWSILILGTTLTVRYLHRRWQLYRTPQHGEPAVALA